MQILLLIANALPWILVGAISVLAVVSSVVCFILGKRHAKKNLLEFVFVEDKDEGEEDNEIAQQVNAVEEEKSMDKLFIKALWLAVNTQTVSISQLQRRFQIGYARAGGLVDKMERMGFVSPHESEKARRVLITKEQFEEKYGSDRDAIIFEEESPVVSEPVQIDPKVEQANQKFFEKVLWWCVVNTQTVSISQLQRRFQIGYARAGGLIDKMENMGFISSNNGAKARNVLLTKKQYIEKFGLPEEE